MNTRDKSFLLPDIQSQADTRGVSINAVGIKAVRYPLTIRSGGKNAPTIATLSMTVGLTAATKGTHMSRFIELLEAQTEALDQERFKAMLFDMLDILEADSGAIDMRFPYFAQKTAPVSGVRSLLDYDVCWCHRQL